ncbi:MAG: hypothetical protein ACKV2Q_21490 [Planctomycetaceae bacterium]
MLLERSPFRADEVGKLVEENILLAFFDDLIKTEAASTTEGADAKSEQPAAESTQPAVNEPDSDPLPKDGAPPSVES